MKNKINLLFTVFIFLGVFFVYLITLNPVFHADDSPETIACSYTLGIQHPPGYPLPTLIGKISSLIPVGNIGFRCNLQATFFAVLASIILYFIIINFFKIKILDNIYINLIALISILTFAFSYTLWSQALSAKGGIYTLNAFLLALLIYVIFLWEKTKEDKFIYLFIYIFGISLGNHWESMAVVTPAFFIFVLMSLKEMNKKITMKNILFSVFFFMTGIFIYYYLIIRARSNAYLNWGDPVDLKQLLWVITRAEYTSLEKARDFIVVLKQIRKIFQNIIFEFTIFGFILFLLGCIYFFNKKRKYFIFLILLILCVLLGDGAGAVIIGRTENGEILSTVIHSDGSKFELLYQPGGGCVNPASEETVKNKMHYLKMNGAEIFKLAVEKMPEVLEKALNNANIKPEQVDFVIFHQANIRIINNIAKRFNWPEEKNIVNIQKYGNTSAATIPIALSEAIEQGRIKRGNIIALSAFGAGLTWAGAVIKL